MFFKKCALAATTVMLIVTPILHAANGGDGGDGGNGGNEPGMYGSFWSDLNKKLSVALKAHFRTTKSRSSSAVTTAPKVNSSKVAGEAPAHESSEELLY